MKTKIRLLPLLLGFLLLGTSVFSQDPNFYIYLCFGQSNMEGQGTIEAQDQTVDSRFRVMEAVNCSNLGRTMGSWYTAVPPLTRCYNGLSPADYFGKTMVANLPSNIRVGVINVSVAGCKIELFDKYNYPAYVATVESWMRDIINAYGGNPYGRLIEIAKLAQNEGVIKGILLHQGESNVGDNAWPSKVKGVYNNLIADLGLDPTKVPLLAGEVVNADQGGICASVNSIIATLPQTLPNSYVISSSGCTDAADNLHFNSAGYRELGRRYAVKMLSLLGTPGTSLYVSPTSVSVAASANSTGTFGVTSNTSWTVSSNQSWLTVSPASGSNNATVTVTAQQNTGTSTRSATVTVSATGVSSQTVTVTQSGTGGGGTTYINVGGPANGSFSADQYFSGGSTYTNSATIDMSQITSNAPPAAIFNTERYGSFSYTIPNRAAGSAQTVTLYFAETYLSASGQRTFNVSINGSSVLSNFDIYASAGGQNKAIARTFNTTANSSGQVVIQFSSVTENPKVNGITVADGGSVSTLSVSPTSLSVGSAANSTGSFSITSNVSWTVSSNQSWLAVSPASGSNNGSVTVTAQQNTSTSTRSTTVTVSATGVTSQTVTVTQAAATTASNMVMLEAECGTVGSLFNVTADANASNGTFATVIPGNNSTASAPASATGWITLPFTIGSTGTYSLWARVMCPDANGDSYWLKMDNGSFAMWNGITVSTSWTWVKYTSTFSLSTTGSHTLTIGYREDGARLDKIYITSAGDTPSGTGSAASNLCSPVFKSAAVFADNGGINTMGVSIYPNPVSSILNITLPGSPSVISLYNSGGQQLLKLNTEDANATIDMANYMPGVYFLMITNSDQTSIEKLIKQ